MTAQTRAATRAAVAADVTHWRWHSVRVRLKNRRWHPGATANVLVLLRALALEACAVRPAFDVVFNLVGHRAPHLPVQADEVLDVEYRFFGVAESDVHAWCSRLASLAGERTDNNVVARVIRAPRVESAAAFFGERVTGDEICLDFTTPCAAGMTAKQPQLPFAAFASLVRRRLLRAFGVNPALPSVPLRALDGYWRFDTRLNHRSRSEGGEPYTLSGCAGPYYLRGDVQAWWPWLRLAQATLVGERTTFGLGRFDLSAPGPASVSRRLGDAAMLHAAYEHVASTYDDALEQIAATETSAFDSGVSCTRLGEALRAGTFVPAAARSFVARNTADSLRHVERPTWQALVVARHLHDLLAESIDRRHPAESLGNRKGRTHDEAAAFIDAAIADRYRYVVEADIEDGFASIDLKRLVDGLAAAMPRADTLTVEAVRSLLIAPWRDTRGHERPREHGLAIGSPLSALLANVHLHAVGNALADAGVRAVRCGDDILLLCRDRDHARRALGLLRGDASRQSALADDAARIRAVAEGFDFAGLHYPRGNERPPPTLPPLHVIEPGAFLALHGDAIEVRVGGVPRDVVPLRRVGRIVLHAPGALSTALLQRCADRREPVPIVFAAGPYGRALVVEADSARRFDAAQRQARRYEELGSAGRLDVAKALIDAKISNATLFLRGHRAAGVDDALVRLRGIGRAIVAARSMGALREMEGAAESLIFARLALVIEIPAFAFERRDRDCADRFNAVLNYGYYLLFLYANLELRALGLNPFLGFLRESNDESRYETLAYDVQQLFRGDIEALLVRLVNAGGIDAASIVQVDGRYRLGRESMRTIALQFERELRRAMPGRSLTLAQAITAQCLNLRDFLVDGASLYCHRWSEPA